LAAHRFSPTRFYNVIGTAEPACTIADGDSVVTTTLDAAGFDEHGEHPGELPNPMTGPFFITGAEPGDTLRVRIDRMTPNRATGWTFSVLAPNVVDPGALRRLPERARVDWIIERGQNTARLAEPPARLRDFVAPLAPMIGCFGVAPAGGQALSTATSGPNGGNMDYRGFGPGVTVFFPVSVAGALFYLGDGHAAQGDGEIVGTGIETSFEIAFTVQLLKGKRIGWPRGENDDDIFTVGNARPLDQALQHATTEMIRWLQTDYRLDPLSVGLLLGQAVEYDLGNVFDPAYTMVCKLSKDRLKHLA
jgi:acetamidase/formamidase